MLPFCVGLMTSTQVWFLYVLSVQACLLMHKRLAPLIATKHSASYSATMRNQMQGCLFPDRLSSDVFERARSSFYKPVRAPDLIDTLVGLVARRVVSRMILLHTDHSPRSNIDTAYIACMLQQKHIYTITSVYSGSPQCPLY